MSKRSVTPWECMLVNAWYCSLGIEYVVSCLSLWEANGCWMECRYIQCIQIWLLWCKPRSVWWWCVSLLILDTCQCYLSFASQRRLSGMWCFIVVISVLEARSQVTSCTHRSGLLFWSTPNPSTPPLAQDTGHRSSSCMPNLSQPYPASTFIKHGYRLRLSFNFSVKNRESCWFGIKGHEADRLPVCTTTMSLLTHAVLSPDCRQWMQGDLPAPWNTCKQHP